jgi:hypothetical protein
MEVLLGSFVSNKMYFAPSICCLSDDDLAHMIFVYCVKISSPFLFVYKVCMCGMYLITNVHIKSKL